MFSPTRVRSKPAANGTFAKLTTAGGSLRRPARRRAILRWGRRLLVAVAAVVVLWLLFVVAVRILTTDLWFDSVHDGSVYTTMVRAQILLFCIFGILAGAVGALVIVAVRRIRPLYVSSDDDTFRWMFRKVEPRLWRLLVVLAVVIPAVLVGRQAAGGWQTYLMWRHSAPWHATDPLFHKDISFFLEVYPFHVMVVALLAQALTYGIWIAVIAGYWYGAWRLRRGRRKISRGFTILLSLLAAGYLVVKALNYWLSRYALTTSGRGPVTGASYTDAHAALPSKYVLMALAIAGAAALVANAFLASRVRALAGVLVVMIVASTVVGSAWPGLVYHFQEAPSAAKVDLGEIADNQSATRAAFGLDGDVTTVPYQPATTTDAAALTTLAGTTAQTSVIDPNELSPTFNVEQQLQAYYGFKSTLDTGHYDLGGGSQDVELAVRELRANGIPHPSWVNNHLVYTHGYGVVAAPTTTVDAKTETPVFLDGGMPPEQQIPVTRPQVYFGQAFGASSYSIVGQPAGSHQQTEFDHPGGNGSSASAYTTYQGHGGIPIGSTLRRLLFAVQLHDPNIFFSSELNGASQLLTVRDPRARVAKIAPWLTLDGDVYPAVVGGHIEWVVDGYTTSANYPDAQSVNLHTATKTTLTANGASVAQPNQQVNYFQNSVKAVVDAYTGQVTLYAWNQQQHPDPLLNVWESVFPGLVQSQASIPAVLLPQLRYPTDLFNIQRSLLARYHVTQPASFYSGNDFWTVPADPTVAAAKSLNATASHSASSPPLPSKYLSLSADGSGTQQYSLSSPMVTLNGQQLASFVSVDAEPGPDYGKFTVLEFPSALGRRVARPGAERHRVEHRHHRGARRCSAAAIRRWCWAIWRPSRSRAACCTWNRSTPSRAAARPSRSCGTSSRCTATVSRPSTTAWDRPSRTRSPQRPGPADAASAAAVLELGGVRNSAAGAVGEPALRKRDGPGAGGTAAGLTDDRLGECLRQIQLVQQVVEFSERRRLRHGRPHRRADGESLEIPSDVLAEVGDATVFAHPLRQQRRVPAHDPRDLVEARTQPVRPTFERGTEIAEQPRPPETAAADDDTGAARLDHHP